MLTRLSPPSLNVAFALRTSGKSGAISILEAMLWVVQFEKCLCPGWALELGCVSIPQVLRAFETLIASLVRTLGHAMAYEHAPASLAFSCVTPAIPAQPLSLPGVGHYTY